VHPIMVVVILGWMKKGRSIVTALELPCMVYLQTQRWVGGKWERWVVLHSLCRGMGSTGGVGQLTSYAGPDEARRGDNLVERRVR